MAHYTIQRGVFRFALNQVMHSVSKRKNLAGPRSRQASPHLSVGVLPCLSRGSCAGRKEILDWLNGYLGLSLSKVFIRGGKTITGIADALGGQTRLVP